MTNEEVLTLPAEKVADLFREPRFYDDTSVVARINELIHTDGRFVDRGWAEDHSSVKQIVAYAVVRSENKWLCIRRTKKANRDVLRLKYTLLFGGHVDQQEKSSQEPLVKCLLRELKEEFDVVPFCAPIPIGIVADPTTQVGKLHLGFVFEIHLKQDFIEHKLHLDNGEFVIPEKEKKYELLAAESIIKLFGSFDPWSELLVQSRKGREIFQHAKPKSEEPGQLLLPFP